MPRIPPRFTDKLEKALQAFRLGENLTPDQYRLARSSDVELLAVLERLEKRLREMEER